jgi:hypothetical protein
MFAGLRPSSSDLAERKAMFRHLLQIGGATIESPTSSSLFGQEARSLIAPPIVGRAICDARRMSVHLSQQPVLMTVR